MIFSGIDDDPAGEDSDPEVLALKVQDYNSIFESEMGTSEITSVHQTHGSYFEDPFQYDDEQNVLTSDAIEFFSSFAPQQFE